MCVRGRYVEIFTEGPSTEILKSSYLVKSLHIQLLEG